MPDPTTLAGVLLVLGPVVGAIPVAYPPLLRVWSMPREDHARTIAAHRTGWRLLNGGFVLATVSTAGGLSVLARPLAGENPASASLVAALAVVYAIAGALWCTVLAIRSVATPALVDLGLVDAPPREAERLLHAATGGGFAAFVLVTGVALVALGAGLALTGAVAAPVGWLAALVAGIAVVGELATGDTIPAVLYLPTMLIGLALLAGWR
jgi:hypothetical protein